MQGPFSTEEELWYDDAGTPFSTKSAQTLVVPGLGLFLSKLLMDKILTETRAKQRQGLTVCRF
jgi:hypothetical protein